MIQKARVLRHDDARPQSVIPGKFEFKHLHGQGCSVALYRMRSAADLPTQLNCHEEEVTIMLSGECKLHIDGEDIIPRAGDTILIPSFKEHLGEFLTDEVVLVTCSCRGARSSGRRAIRRPGCRFWAIESVAAPA